MKWWFEKSDSQLEDVDRALRHAPRTPKPDPALHETIMRAVRAARREEPQQRRAPIFVWGVAIAGAAAMALLAAVVMRQPAPVPAPRSLAMSTEMAQAPGAALDLGEQMPAMLMAPLSNEMARVDRDLHHTTQVLLASFP